MNVAEAARRLAAGDLVAFPTETVYGLGADAANPKAVAKVFALKGRPAEHPLIVHVGDPASVGRWAAEVPAVADELIARFWPGPLTLILKRSRHVPDAVTGGQDTVGIRCPSHPVARELLAELARIGSGAVAAPSANRFGHVSPTTAQHVRDEFGDAVPVIDGGESDVGLESTILDLSRGTPVLLRPGGIPRSELARLIGEVRDRDATSPRASGTLAAHYAPRSGLRLVDGVNLRAEAAGGESLAVLAFQSPPEGARPLMWIVAASDAGSYAHDLYANLRKLDASGARHIVVEAPPREAAWEAINDRLERAAAGAGADDQT